MIHPPYQPPRPPAQDARDKCPEDGFTMLSSHRAARRISAVRSVVIERPLEQTLSLVRDTELLEPLERKARAVEVHPTQPGSEWYRIHGKLARFVPWTGDFSFSHSENGWHSATCTHARTPGASLAVSS